MSKYKGLFTFDADSHRFVPIGQSDEIVVVDDTDYVSTEPLIKDPKIRKAVRAWAEANAIVYINRYDSESFVDADGSTCIDFDVDESIFNDVPFGRNLTIDELCGEEKE